MKKILCLILIACCFLVACKIDTAPTPVGPAKPLQIVISNITSSLTVYGFSVTDQSSKKLIDISSQTQNNTYSVSVKHGDVLKLYYFLEIEGPSLAVAPVISFIYDGVTMASVTNNSGIISGDKYITIP
jgi:hypothetical protein